MPVVLGGVEAGGTSFVISIAHDAPTNIVKRYQIATTTPEETLAKASAFLIENKVQSIGVASFGPVDIDPSSDTYGYITSTPKPKWKNVNILGAFKKIGVPVGFNTDVQAAAIGEIEHGKHGNISSCCYITIGTGVGVGVVIGRQAVCGLTHPEGGHIRIKRHPQDTYEGNCPYHHDCVEGLTNAQAVAKRAGVDPSQLKTLPDSHPVWDLEAYYLAQLCASLTLIVSPHVIVIGGGVPKRKILFSKIRQQLIRELNGYVQIAKILNETDRYIVSSVHDQGEDNNAGSVGALELARLALHSHKPSSKL